MHMALLEQLLSGFEGDRLKVYDDATGKPIVKGSVVIGNPTIGHGRCLSTDGITQDEDNLLFLNDCNKVKNQVAKALPWVLQLSESRQDVFYCMCFQMGLGGLLSFHNFLAYSQAGQWQQAHDELINSVWHKETGTRCDTLAGMLLTG